MRLGGVEGGKCGCRRGNDEEGYQYSKEGRMIPRRRGHVDEKKKH